MSGWASIRARRPARTTLWSSASRTRSLGSGMGSGLLVGRRQGDSGDQGGAGAGGGLDLQGAAERRQPLAHAEQAEAAGPGGEGGVEADAVVLDDGDRPAALALQDDADEAGAGVAGDVGEPLLDDPVQ